MFRKLFINDWHYKVLSLFMSVCLWLVLNLGERVPVAIERQIELANQEKGYEYRLERKRAKIRLKVMERFVSEEAIEKIGVSVDLKGLREGDHTLKPEVKNIPRFFVSVEKAEPEYVRVKVIRAPEGGR